MKNVIFIFLLLFSFNSYADNIRLIVPSSIGGSTDIAARILAKNYELKYSNSVIIQNKPSGGIIIGADFVTKATPNGKTLLLAHNSITITSILNKNLPYDIERDFIPIAQLVELPSVLVVNSKSKLKTLQDFNTSQLKVGYSGVGSSLHLAIELFVSMSNNNFLMVPYKGGAPALNALLANEVDICFPGITAALPFIKNNQLRAIAITSENRFPLLKNVPTISESGYPNYRHSAWIGLFAPAKTPNILIKQLEHSMITVLKNERTVIDYENNGMKILANDGKKFKSNISDELVKWKKLVKERNITFE